MPAGTPSWDEQDARDRTLLDRGAIDELLAGYVDLIRARCRSRCGVHGDDVAQQVCLRLWRELEAGKHRGPKPFREIVNGVVAFMCKGWQGATLGRDVSFDDLSVPEDDASSSDIAEEVARRLDKVRFVASLPPGDSEVARLRLIDLREIDEIVEATGRTRNAVDQALFRIRREWAKWLES
jgi:DNA-directed RNA polymerase specialized sigma24 family protein